MNQEKIKIIIADDHKVIRATWKLILQQNQLFSIVAECDNGAELIQALQIVTADVILMDINMQPVNSFEAAKKILNQFPSLKIIGISIHDQPSYARNMLKLGANGFVTKDSSKEEMTNAIITVYNGGKYISEDIRKKMRRPNDDEFLDK